MFKASSNIRIRRASSPAQLPARPSETTPVLPGALPRRRTCVRLPPQCLRDGLPLSISRLSFCRAVSTWGAQGRCPWVTHMETPIPRGSHFRRARHLPPGSRFIFLTWKRSHATHENVPQPLLTSHRASVQTGLQGSPFHVPPRSHHHHSRAPGSRLLRGLLGPCTSAALPCAPRHRPVLHPSRPARSQLFSRLPEVPSPCPLSPWLTPSPLTHSIGWDSSRTVVTIRMAAFSECPV